MLVGERVIRRERNVSLL